MKSILITVVIILISGSIYSQNIDSLKKILRYSNIDSTTAEINKELSLAFGYSNLDSAFFYAKAAELKITNLSSKQKCSIIDLFGILNSMKGRNDLALDYFLRELKIAEEANLNEIVAKTNLNIAFIFQDLGKKEQVFLFFNKALIEAKKSMNKPLIDEILSNGSDFYFNSQNYVKALELWNQRLSYNPQIRDDVWFISGIGDIYRNTENYYEADKYYQKAIDIAIHNSDSSNLITLYSNYALIPEARKDINLAIKYFIKAKKIATLKRDEHNEAVMNSRIANYYLKVNDYQNAANCIDQAIKFYVSKKQTSVLANLYETKSDILKGLNDYRGAYENIIKSNTLKEMLSNQGVQNKISQLESSIVQEQKDKEILLVNKDLQFQKEMRNYFIGGGIILLAFIILIFRSLTLNKSKNKIISQQKLETEKQKHLVEEKQKEIIDSISYAKRLQEAILPPQEFVNAHLANNFIYYQPKDIVAGDFYWADKVNDLFFIAAADSTGHGVPGAMISVVCSNALNRTIKEFKLTETGKILDKTRELVLETFEKSASEVKDGMDISLLCIDSKNKNIFWSGANNPLWYIQDSEIKEIRADKQPIGKSDYPKPFTTHQINYKQNTTFYLFTDGFADQFGGPNGKKFKYKQFSDLLLKNNNLSQKQQADTINKAFSEWKGDLEQVDDVCVIGIKI